MEAHMNLRACSFFALLALVACSDFSADLDLSRRGCEPDDGNEGAAAATPPPVEAEATTSGTRRITQREYDNIVRDLLGDTTRPSATRLPSESRSPFDNDYKSQDV